MNPTSSYSTLSDCIRSNGARAGEVIGLFINGFVSERYGYRKTMIGALMSGFLRDTLGHVPDSHNAVRIGSRACTPEADPDHIRQHVSVINCSFQSWLLTHQGAG
jgi:hypothetical protein